MIWELDDQKFNDNIADVNGTYWYVQDVTGWDGGGVRQKSEAPTSRHGTYATESQVDERTITLKGLVKATTETNFWIAYNRLLALTNNIVKTRPLIGHEDQPKRIDYVRGGVPRLTFVGIGAVSYELPLLCRDPFKRAITPQVTAVAPGATVNVPTQGTFESYPSVTVTTAGTVSLKNTTYPQTLTTGTQSLAAGAVIDFNLRTVYEGTTNRYSMLDSTSVWWTLQPGVNDIYNGGTAQVSFSTLDTWI